MIRFIDNLSADLVGVFLLLPLAIVILYSVLVRQPLHVELSWSPFSLSLYFQPPEDNGND